MAPFFAHIRVLHKETMAKFSHFSIDEFPEFEVPYDLKLWLLQEHSTLLAPAEDCSFRIGYFVEGRGNRKMDIVDEKTLKQAYERASVDRRVTLWIDPHDRSVKKASKRSINVGEYSIYVDVSFYAYVFRRLIRLN